MMEAALSAGLLGLMHKILNCHTSKPLRLDITALKGARIADGDQAATKLLIGAQRCLPPRPHPGSRARRTAGCCPTLLLPWCCTCWDGPDVAERFA